MPVPSRGGERGIVASIVSGWPIIIGNEELPMHLIADSSKSNTHVLCHGIKADIDHKKSIYFSMMPYSIRASLGKKPYQ